MPYFRSDRDGKKKSEDYKEYSFRPPLEPFVSVINSSLFYFYWQVFFDGFKAGKACVEGFPCKPRLGTAAPAGVAAMGRVEILRHNRLGLICSIRCPARAGSDSRSG